MNLGFDIRPFRHGTSLQSIVDDWTNEKWLELAGGDDDESQDSFFFDMTEPIVSPYPTSTLSIRSAI